MPVQFCSYLYPPNSTFPPRRRIYAVSDGTANTCESVMLSALCQFQGISVEVHKYADVATREELRAIVEDAGKHHGIVMFTFVIPELIEEIYSTNIYHAVPTIDVLGHVFTQFGNLLQLSPMGIPGALRKVDDEYYKRIRAINFSVEHDDGRGLETVRNADIVILGISRASKTPVSIYLSYRGLRVANVPVILDLPLPTELNSFPVERMVGLLVSEDRLYKIRESRRQEEKLPPSYSDPEVLHREVTYALRLYRKLGCTTMDVTSKSIEETATEILNLTRLKGLRLSHDT